MRNRRSLKTCLVAGVVALLATSKLQASIWYVKQDATGGGTSWADASGNLKNILDNAQALDEVWVAKGTYTPGTQTSDKFELEDWVKVYGGFAGTEDPATFDPENDGRDFETNETVLSGFLDGGEQSQTLVYASGVDDDTVLDGFTITGATEHAIWCVNQSKPTLSNLIVTGNQSSNDYGGAGILNQGSSPTLSNCEFSNNTSAKHGGAMSNFRDSSWRYSHPVIESCLFQNNTSTGLSGAGAIACDGNCYPRIRGCEFIQNQATYSSAKSGAIAVAMCGNSSESRQFIVRNSSFRQNSASTDSTCGAGALNVGWSASGTQGALVINCDFQSNTAMDGGAVRCRYTDILNCSFSGNSATGDGGAVYAWSDEDIDLINCEFSGNIAGASGSGLGGAAYCSGENFTMINCTLSSNQASNENGGGGLTFSNVTSTIRNSIFWNNTSGNTSTEDNQICLSRSSVDITYSCIQGLDDFAGNSNIGDDPLFADELGSEDSNPGTGDEQLWLLDGSPCLDAGTNAVLPADTYDLDEDGVTTGEFTPDLRLYKRVIKHNSVDSLGNCDSVLVDMGAHELAGDCNANGILDYAEIDACDNDPECADIDTNDDTILDACQDCNGNGDPDVVDIETSYSQDCNLNCTPDECDIASGTSDDCNNNDIPDECDVAVLDCNDNNDPDDCDIASGDSQDCNSNNIPDECDVATLDCNANSIPDDCDIASGDSKDCNNNSVPDECELAGPCHVEIVFVIDTSASSSDDNIVPFCQNVALPLLAALEDVQNLTMQASYLGIAFYHPSSCGDSEQWLFTNTNVLDIFDDSAGTIPVPGDGTSCPLDHPESWGPATAVVADSWDWLPFTNTRRIIITLSDECACRGGPCDAEDNAAISNAINVANSNDVTTYCVVGLGSNADVRAQASLLADGTGGLSLVVDDQIGATPSDKYAAIATQLIADIVPTDDCHDCNYNGVVDACECTRGNMTDTDAPELVNGYDIQDFVTCLLIGDPSPDGCYCADMNDDLALDMDDVPCFVELLIDGETDCTLNPCLWEDEGEGQAEAMMASPDCNENGRTDSHDLILGISEDANGNGIPDECDISAATSADINTNGVPDESEPDLNGNGVPDDVDISTATSADVNSNGIPDEAEDCNGNGYPDEWEIVQGITPDCNNNGTPDDCDDDCNANGVPDDCEIDPTDPDGDGLVSPDCNGNGFPDECDFDWLLMFSLDCNENGIPDECDVASGTSQDCSNNGFPDECDIAAGISADTNTNGVPDECESLTPLGGGVPFAAESYSFPLSGGFAMPLDESEAWAEFYTWHWSQQWGSVSPLSGAEQFSLMVNKLQELGLPVDASSL